MFTYRGANRALIDELAQPDIVAILIAARHVHFASPIDPDLLIELAAQLHRSGCTASLDVGWQVDWLRNNRTLTALRSIDLFLPNKREGELVTGQSDPAEILQVFAAQGVAHVALKLGEQGSMLLRSDEVLSCAPHPINAVDPTGAGDCFDAGFIHAWLNGESPTDCLRLANLCGALSTRSFGGITAFPTLSETTHLLNSSD
jgi:sugar/nucleoside kinase (ribokinase family)